jgi:hypothetical protein
MKMAVFWDAMLCVWWKFTDVAEVLAESFIRVVTQTASISEMSVNFY